MAKKKDNRIVLHSLTFECKKCGETWAVDGQDLSVGVDSNPCDVCGSHSEVYTHKKCPKCGNFQKIEIYSDL